MASTWVLKFPQVDRADQPILVHVTQKQGSATDLVLLATDGDEAYSVKHRHLSKLRSANFEGTDEEWADLIQYIFVSKTDSTAREDLTRNLEVDCIISRRSSPATLSITLRSRIEDITHKLGAVDLTLTENTDDVDLFGWACQLADQKAKLEEQAATHRKDALSSLSAMKELEKKFVDLVEAKKEHEDQLLTKFVMLLNEKKAKIRDQQRILQTAKVDRRKVDEVERAIHGRKETSPNKLKRRRDVSEDQAGGSNDSSDGFEAMDVDKNSAEDDQDGTKSGQVTPSHSDTPETQTASEDDDTAVPVKSSNTSRSQTAKSKQLSPPPPQRSLPFQRRGHPPKPADPSPRVSSPKSDKDEETETEEDEL